MGIIAIALWSIPTLLACLIICATYIFWKRAKYFKNHKIPYLGTGISRTLRMIGGSLDLLDMEKEIITEANKVNAPIAAVSDVFGGVSIYIMDPHLLKNIYVKDFNHFINRRPIPTQAMNKYQKRLIFGLENEKWKSVRSKVSPAFTTGRIRQMHKIFQTSSESMMTFIKNQSEREMNLTQIFSKYSMDVIAKCAFGVNSKCWNVPDLQSKSKFEQMAFQFFQFKVSGKVLLKLFLALVLPSVAKFFGVEAMDTEPLDYFTDVIKQVMKIRRQSGQRLDDFLQLMMDVNDGLVTKEDSTTQQHGNFDEDDVIANSLQFLLGGYDPTQSVLLFATYELALEQEIQDKLFKSVKTLMNSINGHLDYESLTELTYLDMVVNETLRIFPPTIRTERCCNKEVSLPGTEFVIEKGMIISIPIYCIHHDERYFENSAMFIPERFSPENKSNLEVSAFMPFGHGPRSCIGSRFALNNLKTALAYLVYNFRIETCSRTNVPVELENGTSMKPKGGMWLNLVPR